MLYRFPHLLRPAVLCAAAATLALTGCGLGNVVAPNSTDTVASGFKGILHGGPNPVQGAEVIIYATTSNGYGVGTQLEEATQVGSSAHQDTDQYGTFSFAPGFTCPAGQQAYIVAYGGNTGGNTPNPNSILMTALGDCNTLYTGNTVYNGSSVFVSEATTVAAAYALNNFISIAGNAVSGYTVGIGAPASNNGTEGCVPNSYFAVSTNTCTTITAAGLAHAFTNAAALVNTSTGVINSTTPSGANVPTILLGTLADILQSCVNSSGGGTSTSTGLPTTTTTSSGTTDDGTHCGKLFAYTSYTNNGAATGTLTAAGNTLQAAMNLAKRPTGSASTTYTSMVEGVSSTSCTPATASSTTPATYIPSGAVSCLFNLVPTNGYQTALTSAPPDFMVGISYPKGSLGNGGAGFTTTGSTPAAACNATTASNGLLYPEWAATDINDNLTILNTDQSTAKCSNVIAIGFDGKVIGASPADNTFPGTTTANAGLRAIANDAYGHAIVPDASADGVRFYQYAAGGTPGANDSTLGFTTISSGNTGTATNAAFRGYYVMADANSRIYLGSQNGVNTIGYLSPTTLSHTAPAYTPVAGTTTTSSIQGLAIDFKNDALLLKSTYPLGYAANATNYVTDSAETNGYPSGTSATFDVVDTSGNIWQVLDNGATTAGTATDVIKYSYSVTGTTLSFGATYTTIAAPTYSFPLNTDAATNLGTNVSPRGTIDSNNVIWFADLTGSSSAATQTVPVTTSSLRGYDTVNAYGTAQLQGCRTNAAFSYAITGYTETASGTMFTTSVTPPSVGSTLTLSGFGTTTALNGQNATVTAVVTTSGSTSFTVSQTYGLTAGATTPESGTASTTIGTTCGSNYGDANYPSSTPYTLYGSRTVAVDTMGNLWVPNGGQGTLAEIIGIAAPTLPNYIHNGVSTLP